MKPPNETMKMPTNKNANQTPGWSPLPMETMNVATLPSTIMRPAHIKKVLVLNRFVALCAARFISTKSSTVNVNRILILIVPPGE